MSDEEGRDDTEFIAIVTALLKGHGPTTEDEILAVFRAWDLAKVTCACFKMVATGGGEFLIDLKNGEPVFFKPKLDFKTPTGEFHEDKKADQQEAERTEIPSHGGRHPGDVGAQATPAEPTARVGRRSTPNKVQRGRRGPCDKCGAEESKWDQHKKVFRCAECWRKYYLKVNPILPREEWEPKQGQEAPATEPAEPGRPIREPVAEPIEQPKPKPEPPPPALPKPNAMQGAWESGHAVGKKGGAMLLCPFGYTDPRRKAWTNGWMQGTEERKRQAEARP